MAKVILVYDSEKQNSRVVSEGVLLKDIRKVLALQESPKVKVKGSPKVKVKDVKEFAKDFMSEHNGSTLTLGAYESHVNKAAESLSKFVNLTPYQYYTQNQ